MACADSATAWTKVVFPAPKSPVSQTTLPGPSSRQRRAPSAKRSCNVTLRVAEPLSTPAPPPRIQVARARPGRRTPHGVILRLQLEQLVTELGRELEVQLGRGFPHLLLQRGDERFPVR